MNSVFEGYIWIHKILAFKDSWFFRNRVKFGFSENPLHIWWLTPARVYPSAWSGYFNFLIVEGMKNKNCLAVLNMFWFLGWCVRLKGILLLLLLVSSLRLTDRNYVIEVLLAFVLLIQLTVLYVLDISVWIEKNL